MERKSVADLLNEKDHLLAIGAHDGLSGFGRPGRGIRGCPEIPRRAGPALREVADDFVVCP